MNESNGPLPVGDICIDSMALPDVLPAARGGLPIDLHTIGRTLAAALEEGDEGTHCPYVPKNCPYLALADRLGTYVRMMHIAPLLEPLWLRTSARDWHDWHNSANTTWRSWHDWHDRIG